MMNKVRWRLTRVNDWYEMTRRSDKSIECRKLYWWEYLFYFAIGKLQFERHIKGYIKSKDILS